MKRNLLLVLTASLLIAADAKDDAVKEVEKAITVLNKAFEKGDAEALKALMTDDHVAITPSAGVETLAQQLKDLPHLKITEYVQGKLTVKLLSKDVALVTYPLTLKGTFKGKPLAEKLQATAVFVRREGKWLEASYQETPLESK
jgi:uncharacterized protein (TIGR02246 family)